MPWLSHFRKCHWLLLTALALGAVEIAALLWNFIGSSFTYFGGGDARAIQIAWKTYSTLITNTSGELVVIGMSTTAALAVPLTPVFRRWFKRFGAKAVLLVTATFIWLRCLWIAAAMIRIPSLFSDMFYQDGRTASALMMRQLCSVHGAVLLATVVVVSLVWLTRALPWQTRVVIASPYFVLACVVLFDGRVMRVTKLPERSVVIVLADSLRRDFYDRGRMPELHALAKTNTATLIDGVWPPIPRTGPSVTALLTGKLPAESGVTTMFSPESTFDQNDSIVRALRDKGYCTLAVSEYPGEFFRKYDYGFEYVDAPRVRFKEITGQLLLGKSTIALATLSVPFIRRHFFAKFRELIEGLPTFADGPELFRRLAHQAKRCEKKPVFAFVFADQPHFPYVQTWPSYLALDDSYAGPYRFHKDAISTPANATDKQRIRDLYTTSMAASDDNISHWLDAEIKAGWLENSTIIISGDHGESLYDKLGIMGHGDQLGEEEGIAVPWLVFGRERNLFEMKAPVSSLFLTPLLAQLADLPWTRVPAIPQDTLYLETDAWLAETPNIPADRVKYPSLSQLLTIHSPESHIVIADEFTSVVDYAKFRRFIENGHAFEIRPQPKTITYERDGKAIRASELPLVFRALIEKYDATISTLLLH